MTDNTDYTIDELLEEAKKDPGWEPDPDKREILVGQLERFIESI